MTISYFVEEGFASKQHLVNKYATHKFDDDNFLITTEHGAWVVLNKNEFELLESDRITEDLNLFSVLEEKGVIVTENSSERIAQMYKKRFHHLSEGISTHVIVPSSKCYHKACQTSSDTKGFNMDRDTAKSVVDFIFQSPSKNLMIKFQGCDPLANFSVVEFIVDYVKRKNRSTTPNEDGWLNGKKEINFKIFSSFRFLDEDILDFLIENRISIETSLDGPKKHHNKNRQLLGGNSYEKVVYWINMINQKGYDSISVIPNITHHSLSYPKQIVDEYLRIGLDCCWVKPLDFSRFTQKIRKKIEYSPEEFFNFWKNYFEYVLKLNRKEVTFIDQTTVDFLKRITSLKQVSNDCFGAPCDACIRQTAYDPKGEVYTCEEARFDEIFRLGNVKESNYKKIFTSNNALNFVGLTSMVSSFCDRCEWHPYCSPCLVSSYGAKGNLISSQPNDFLCKIRGAQVEYLFKKLLFKSDKKILFEWLKR
jgi:radical SAM protein with 4Fe4S-binding SPASM domain